MNVHDLVVPVRRTLVWALVMPLVGLALLTILLSFVMLFLLLFAPLLVLKTTMIAGVVPSLFPAAAFVALEHRLPRIITVLLVAAISALAAWLWWGLILVPGKQLSDYSPMLLWIAALATLPMTLRRRTMRSGQVIEPLA